MTNRKKSQSADTSAEEQVRLDKWLWMARFYKTRQLAAEAIQGGKVHLQGQRCKPGKHIQVGNQLSVKKGAFQWDIEVQFVPKQRRPASEAQDFYLESADSLAKRQALSEQIRAERAAQPATPVPRPNKRERRLIHRFKRIQD